MSTLGRRLDSLEALAEEARLRPYRALAEERGVPFEAFMGILERCRAESARLRAEGLTDDAIIARTAARMGITPEELRRRGEALATRYFS